MNSQREAFRTVCSWYMYLRGIIGGSVYPCKPSEMYGQGLPR